MVQFEDSRMGRQVRIFNNRHYKGKQAWLNRSKGKKGITGSMVHLLVALVNKDGNSYLHETMLSKKGVYIMKDTIPTSFEEAVLQAHPDVEKEMDGLAEKLALHRITENNNIDRMGTIFCKKIVDASDKLLRNTDTKYIHTDWDEL